MFLNPLPRIVSNDLRAMASNGLSRDKIEVFSLVELHLKGVHLDVNLNKGS